VSSQENKSKFGVSINGGLGFPLGDFNEVYKMGFGFNTSIFYALEETTELGAVIGYFSWSFDNSKFNNAFKDAGLEGNFNVAAPIHVLPLLIQVKFKLPREDFNPYILIEGGIYYTSVQLSGTFTSPDTTITFDEPTIKNSEAGMSFGLGTEIPSSENLEFDIRLTYHLVPTVNIYNFGSIGYQKDVSTNKFISVVAGVNYLF
jgi:hypothetical protein